MTMDRRDDRSSPRWWVALVPVIALAAPAFAQDGQYWTNQTGTRSRLLGGAVIGSPRDLSSVFYNPGALSLNRQPELLLAGNVVEYSKYTVVEADADGSLSDSQFRTTPSLFAGEVRPAFLGKHRIAYSFLQRQRVELHADANASATGKDVLGIPNLGFLADEIKIDVRARDNWYGITWSYPVSETLGIGVSTFAANRSERVNLQNVAQALGTNARGALGIETRDFNFGHWRMLWKIGVAAEVNEVELGLTITTPSVGMWGDGKVAYDDSLITQDIAGSGMPVTEINTDRQKDIPSDWKSPLSIGLGASFSLGETGVHVSAEWFDSVSRYTVLDAEPFTGQTSGETVPMQIESQLESVFNVGVGVSHELRDDLTILGGFHTDFSASTADPNEPRLLPVTDMNIWHLSAGAQFRLAQTQFTLGTVLALGSSQSGLIDSVLGPRALETDFSRFTFILGFDFDFGT